jgi:hypothetical protein
MTAREQLETRGGAFQADVGLMVRKAVARWTLFRCSQLD